MRADPSKDFDDILDHVRFLYVSCNVVLSDIGLQIGFKIAASNDDFDARLHRLDSDEHILAGHFWQAHVEQDDVNKFGVLAKNLDSTFAV